MDNPSPNPSSAAESISGASIAAQFSSALLDPDTAPHGVPPAPVPPAGPNFEERLTDLRRVAARNENVLLAACSDLLRALAEVPNQLSPIEVSTWRRLLKDEIHQFNRLCEQLNIRRDHMLAARYVLCTALDEAASLSEWNVRGEHADQWASASLLPEFHGEREGGNVVFMLLGRMAHAPQEHMPVLELIHHVLSLGFMGNYRTKPDGHRQLDAIRHRLYGIVTAGKEPVGRELSAHWRGVTAGKFRLLRTLPVWVSASLLGLVLLAHYGWYKYQLLTAASALELRIRDLDKLQPAKNTTLGLAQLLSNEIAQGRVQVQEDQRRAQVSFRGDGMFAPGQTAVSPRAMDMVNKVAAALQTVPGQVQVTGHTDTWPVNDPTGINKTLSLGRAQAISTILQAKGVQRGRITVQGKAGAEPLTSNDTPEGRAQNRRVVIELIYADQ